MSTFTSNQIFADDSMSANTITATTWVQIGTAPFTSNQLNVGGTGQVIGAIFSNTTSTGLTTIQVGQNTNNRLTYTKYNSSYAGNANGTTIPLASYGLLSSLTSGVVGDGGLIINGTPIIGLVGSTVGNKGFRADSAGFRIGNINALQTTNTTDFSVDARLTYNSFTSILSNTQSLNSYIQNTVTNANTGAGAGAIQAASNNTNSISIRQLGTNWTTSGNLVANLGWLYATNNMLITAQGGNMKFVVGAGSGSTMELTSSGLTIAGGVTANTHTVVPVIGNNANAAQTIDVNLSDHFTYTLTGNTTFTFSNFVNGKSITIGVTQNSSTSYTSAFAGGTIKWPYAITPVQTPTTGSTDIFTFTQLNSIIYGDYAQSYI